MKSNKERTIEAWIELEAKYLNPVGKEFFMIRACPLCSIHYVADDNGNTKSCKGCPMACENGLIGCNRFNSYLNLADSISCDNLYHLDSANQGCQERSYFFTRTLELIRAHPPEHFTPGGWVYFGLNRDW